MLQVHIDQVFVRDDVIIEKHQRRGGRGRYGKVARGARSSRHLVFEHRELKGKATTADHRLSAVGATVTHHNHREGTGWAALPHQRVKYAGQRRAALVGWDDHGHRRTCHARGLFNEAAGPVTTPPAGTSAVTMEPAPMTASSPMVTPFS